MYTYRGGYICNFKQKDRCATVQSNMDAENRYVMNYKRKSNLMGQKWKIVYVRDWKTYKKGSYHPEYGLFIERPFYVLTALSSRRYLDMLSR
jgi:hypothetical protein